MTKKSYFLSSKRWRDPQSS